MSYISVVKYTKQNGVRNVWNQAGFWRLFGGVAKSRKMRTQICETEKIWLLKMRVECGGQRWGKVDNCGWMGSNFTSTEGGTEAQTASARTVVPMSQKILDFYMKFT